MIRKTKSGYTLYSKSGNKKLGTYKTKGAAQRREKQVSRFKYSNKR